VTPDVVPNRRLELSRQVIRAVASRLHLSPLRAQRVEGTRVLS
jgi:hypothetical protein